MSVFDEVRQQGHGCGKWLAVQYDTEHNQKINVSGIDLVLQHEWRHKSDEDSAKVEENVNLLETTSQICTVIGENPNYSYKNGDRLFCHYMAWESCQAGDLLTKEAFILADYVFFTFMPDGSWRLANGVYIGEQVYTTEQKTDSGIIFDLGNKKETLKVKITHTPPDSNGWVKVGDVVASIDSYNYEFTIYPKKYIKLTNSEIAGKFIDNSMFKPLAL